MKRLIYFCGGHVFVSVFVWLINLWQYPSFVGAFALVRSAEAHKALWAAVQPDSPSARGAQGPTPGRKLPFFHPNKQFIKSRNVSGAECNGPFKMSTDLRYRQYACFHEKR